MQRWQEALGGVFALGLALAVSAPGGQALAQDLTKEQIEGIVKDYLLREPEVVYQALEELQRRRTAAQQAEQKAALAEMQDELLQDPAAPVLGDPDGDVTLVEFFDYRCTYCRRVVASVQSLISDDPNLRIVFKELPVLGEDSVRAARAALAGHKQGGYQRLHFALMAATDLSLAGIKAIAAEQGLDPEQLERDMQAAEINAAIQANYELANALGIEGTPAFVIGSELVPGAVDKDRLEELIAAARAG